MTASLGVRRGSDFAALIRRIREAGLLDRRPGYYLARIALVSTLYAGSWAVLAVLRHGWWALVVAVGLAIAYAQVALVAHDLAHRQVFRSQATAARVGLVVGNLGIGMSYGWWMDKHTRHHANPNHEGEDPDVDPDIMVWSQRQARSARGLVRFVGRWQAYLFFPLLLLEGVNLHVASARGLHRSSLKRRPLEAVLLYSHFVLYLATVFVLLPPGTAVAFVLVHQGLFGLYLGSTFAPNHKGMPTLTAEDDLDYLRRQVLTSRNVAGRRWLDVVYGGLNYQIEHHLFPNMPTPNLRKAQPIVEAYCREIGVAYVATGVVDSYAQALRHLHAAGAPLRSKA